MLINNILYIWYTVFTTVIIPIPLIILSLFCKAINIKNISYFKLLSQICLKLANVKHTIIGSNRHIIKKGFVLPNHRGWFDLVVDEKITGATIVSRYIVPFTILFAGILQKIENKMIVFSRSSTGRHNLYKMCINHLNKYDNLILIFPEGKRVRHNTLNSINEAKSTLKPGFLKSVFEDNKYPVQIIMSANKEKVLDEKRFYFSFGEEVKSIIGDPIYPSDYRTFDEFYNKIANDWLLLWNKVYNSDININKRT